MIWADRIGLGAVAIVAIVLALFYFTDNSAERAAKQEAAFAEKVADCTHPPADDPPATSDGQNISDEEFFRALGRSPFERDPSISAQSDEKFEAWLREPSLLGGVECPPIEPSPISIPTSSDMALLLGKISAYAILPIWLILRVIDFMAGGPARRRSRLRTTD